MTRGGIYQIVRLRLPGVQHLDWVSSARNGENRSLEEVLRELDGVEGGRCHDLERNGRQSLL